MILLTGHTTWLQVALNRSFDESVAAAPASVCDQSPGLEKKQGEELAELESQVDTLLRESRGLRSA